MLGNSEVDKSFIGSSLEPQESTVQGRLVVDAVVVCPAHGTLKFSNGHYNN